MAQRESGYARINGDLYVTPAWVYEALYSVEEGFRSAWDCAPINSDFDFLQSTQLAWTIATNPPFNKADEFVIHALSLTKTSRGAVAMLLPHAWDTAKSRRRLFLAPYKAKYILTRRIRWENLDQKTNGPSSNHAWYVWDWQYSDRPFMDWLPKE